MEDREDGGTVVVATFPHRHQAELARGFLSDAGLPAAVTADDGGGAFGAPLTFSRRSFATVRVNAGDAPEARRLLREAGFETEGGAEAG